MSRRQGCVAAQIDLGFRREPAQVEAIGVPDQEGSFGQVIRLQTLEMNVFIYRLLRSSFA